MPNPYSNTLLGSIYITTAALALFGAVAKAAESGDVTARDRDFMQETRSRLHEAPEFRRMQRDVERLEATLKGERKIPYDAKLHALKLREPALPLTVNPAIRRALQPSVAIIVFDVTGSGRVSGAELIVGGPHPAWGKDVLQMLPDLLFEPWVEGDVGITRVGITMAVYAELDGAGKTCGTLVSRSQVDFELRSCVKVKAEF